MKRGTLKAVTKIDRIDGPFGWTIVRDVHVLILHEAGSYHWLETWLDGHRTSLGDPLPGEMWFVPAGHVHRAEAKGGSVRFVEIEIPSALLAVPSGARPIAAYQDRMMAALVAAVAADEAGAGDALLALLHETLARRVAPPVPPAIAPRIDDLMASIQTQLETPITVEEMAAEVGMSVNSLITNFARATGWTPAQYMLHQRLRRACWFLANRPLSVAEIAFATGFSSHAHLCAAFRRKLAMSPGEWRAFAKGRAELDG
ncbi:helix-turn-helix domain-containing protein [Sphingopyxis sp.]|uniref:AraC family transcriptional regulator n=1 Tax=Sphingopyxis sp. TaxID=1908224 RepID=UPI0035ADAECB